MDDHSAGTGCAVAIGHPPGPPFFIAAIPVLAGIAVGLFFHFVILPVVAWIIVRILGAQVRGRRPQQSPEEKHRI